MSKIGKLPIIIPEDVTAKLESGKVLVTGPKGSLSRKLPLGVMAEISNGKIIFSSKGVSKESKAVFGTTRALVANMVRGVTQGWERELELVGTGFKAETDGKTLILTVGFSHPIKIIAPSEINFKVEKTIIKIEGIDKELVGQLAANIRGVKPPEPYKGKGIKYLGEVIRRKAGKAAKVGATAV